MKSGTITAKYVRSVHGRRLRGQSFGRSRNLQYRVLAEKLKEAAASVLPVTAIVAVLCLALVRVDVGLML